MANQFTGTFDDEEVTKEDKSLQEVQSQTSQEDASSVKQESVSDKAHRNTEK
jgi:hypothetical protein